MKNKVQKHCFKSHSKCRSQNSILFCSCRFFFLIPAGSRQWEIWWKSHSTKRACWFFLPLPGAPSAFLMAYDSVLSTKAFPPQTSWEMLFWRPNTLQITRDLELDLISVMCSLPSMPNRSWLKGSLNKVSSY